MKYIDAEKLTKAIEDKGLDCSFALKMERLDTLALIDELQQEQPEVDLEKEISTWIPAHIRGGDNEVWKDTKKAVTEWGGIVARHFYELGKNARKV